jgi:hypothetical protein
VAFREDDGGEGYVLQVADPLGFFWRGGADDDDARLAVVGCEKDVCELKGRLLGWLGGEAEDDDMPALYECEVCRCEPVSGER